MPAMLRRFDHRYLGSAPRWGRGSRQTRAGAGSFASAGAVPCQSAELRVMTPRVRELRLREKIL